MQSNSKYDDLAVAGKWVTLAREWICDNAPVTRDDYLTAMASLMPRHIRWGGGQMATPLKLANEAYRRITGDSEIPKLITISPVRETSDKTGATRILRGILVEKKEVRSSEVSSIKNAGALLRWLCKKNFCKRVSTGVYRLVEENTEP